jgi:alkylation response protein AidB-like acyl-CoA dehydrogenase
VTFGTCKLHGVDFNDTETEAAWRAECRSWLDEHAPEVARGDGTREAIGSPGYLARAKKWQALKFDHGFAKITWEPEYGGRGGTAMQQVIFNQEEARFDVPGEAFVIGLGMIAPTLRAVGTDAQKARYLTRLLRGDDVWCQLFSEPGAGSDVASLSTLAVRDGDEWVVNGQKVWTSGAQYSDYGEIICRTSPDAEKHRGITAFVVDMRAPGVTVKPLRQMNGGASFNEVFFDDVRVVHDQVLGDVDQGWSVAITTLMNERVAIGSGGGGGQRATVHDVISLAQRRGRNNDALVRQKLADLYIRTRIQRFLGMRSLTAASQGRVPGPEGSIGKLAGARLTTSLGEVAVELVGAAATASADDAYSWHEPLLGSPAAHIAGGSDEVMKNIIGERVLGLPGEPRVDKGIAWRDVPRSA